MRAIACGGALGVESGGSRLVVQRPRSPWTSRPARRRPVMTATTESLRDRTIALVGLMGVGKIERRPPAGRSARACPSATPTTRSRRPPAASISDIFAELGEAEFRAGERAGDRPPAGRAAACAGHRRRRLRERRDPRPASRRKAVSVWLKADLEVLARRVGRKDTRPLLRGKDPLEVLQRPGRGALSRLRRGRHHRRDRRRRRTTMTVEARSSQALTRPPGRGSRHDARPSPSAWASRAYEVLIGAACWTGPAS